MNDEVEIIGFHNPKGRILLSSALPSFHSRQTLFMERELHHWKKSQAFIVLAAHTATGTGPFPSKIHTPNVSQGRGLSLLVYTV